MKKFVFAAIAAMVMVSVSNVFASSKMMIDNSEVVPVDTVAPETPKDSAEVSTPVLPQAGAEDSTDQATPAETTSEATEATSEATEATSEATEATSEATEATSETPAESVDTAQAEQPAAQATVSE